MLLCRFLLRLCLWWWLPSFSVNNDNESVAMVVAVLMILMFGCLFSSLFVGMLLQVPMDDGSAGNCKFC